MLRNDLRGKSREIGIKKYVSIVGIERLRQ
jgi:hypothetical protein